MKKSALMRLLSDRQAHDMRNHKQLIVESIALPALSSINPDA